ncbi:hypothetical protein KEM48_013676 [Puccinia striiformis f. sp. tritici PST-130]|nr:hypothetical protein KEM48_013676 [Puccinia striiformis f. sp. tritici PST-130]
MSQLSTAEHHQQHNKKIKRTHHRRTSSIYNNANTHITTAAPASSSPPPPPPPLVPLPPQAESAARKRIKLPPAIHMNHLQASRPTQTNKKTPLLRLKDQIEARTGKFRRLKYIANCRIKTSDQLSQYAVDHVRSTLSYTQDLADQNPFENYRDQVKFINEQENRTGLINARQRNQKFLPSHIPATSTSDAVNFSQRLQSTIDGTLSTPRPPEPHLPAYEALQARQKLLDEHHSQLKKPKVRKWRKILEPEKQALVQKVLQQNGKISDLPGAYCESHDIRKLKPRQWINDEIFFMAKYDKTGYDGVKRWSKKTDLLSKDIIIFPTNIGNAHWTCAAINLRSKRFEYFDSMGNPNQSVLANLRDYIVHEALLKKKITLDISEWPDCFYQDIPQQNNSFDCGIFVCQFMDCISRDWTSSSSSNNNNNFSNKPLPIDKRESVFDFGQENMEYIRTKMIYEIATKEFLNEEWA